MEVVELPVAATGGGAHGAPPCFDCSICLEPAREPVVTRCGHLYCLVCMRRWMRSADHCPVCRAAVSEGRLLPLCHDHSDLRCFHVRPTAAIVNNNSNHWGASWVWHSNAGCLISSAAAAVLPWAFPVPPRPMIVGDGHRRVKQSLHQLWLFLAVAALLCFLLCY
ncbi:hypothetical protein PVAP13_1NG549500 [Panicum virgatum]|uniref:E3 ubiquitin-protein ligase RMA n=2 Tax=Panicum virgatum TaxID=38727 RepID=A0A8T0XBA9_PANVG|nr:hypothetical protein PVAP13_1NG549500 [Panicum virgatum]